MLSLERITALRDQGRRVELAQPGDSDLGPLQLLPGTWKNIPNLIGRGWNMIALPFATQPDSPIDYRLLLNQYNEELKFTVVDKAVPNRGVKRDGGITNTDQFVVTLDYEQVIQQIAAEDQPVSGLAGNPGIAIHHEPGLWLHMTNETDEGSDIGRLGTIPHGDALLALGKGVVSDGAPTIPAINGLPIGITQALTNPYLAPYEHFHKNPFMGVFDPTEPHLLLRAATPANVVRTTTLSVSTKVETAGIVNIPFITRQANAAEMISTFWIMELEEQGLDGRPRLVMQYLQIVLLDFFQRRDGMPGLIRWPHVSINTMEKIAEPTLEKAIMPV
jgi:hypothetical protein